MTAGGAATAGEASEHTAACCAVGTEVMAEVDHPATCGTVRNLGPDFERQGACHPDPSPATYPAVDQDLVDDGASGLVWECAAVSWKTVSCCSVAETADGRTARPYPDLVFVASELSYRIGPRAC